MKKINALLFLLLISLCSCQAQTEYESYLSRFINRYARIQKTKGLEQIGYGGALNDKIKKIHLYFFFKGQLNIDQARVLLVREVKNLLDIINSDENLQPYLLNYPFTPKNIKYTISLKNSDGSRVHFPYVSLLYLENNCVYYAYLNERDIFMPDKAHKETYQESLEKVLHGS